MEEPELIKKLSASKMLAEPTLLRRKSSLGADFTLQELMHKVFGAEVLASIDFTLLCNHLIKTVTQILERNQFTVDEKVIVENTLALWTGCVLHQNSLFGEFMNWKNTEEGSKIKDTKDFLLAGLLLCPEEKIRMDFANTFTALSNHQEIGEIGALTFLLTILAQNFSKISTSGGRQYFDLFNTLIALKSENILMQEEEIFKPEELMSQVIAKINELGENVSEAIGDEEESEKQTQKALETEGMMVGLI